ncbi:hypothetical protein LTS08_004191 [Lithohypha guttulata]|nr:hypothetical protein LTS08_004191 [Lithohypha guttulata]
MDTDNNPAEVVHKPPPLSSDQLNYLIWRYLQEAGYAEAAVKLQRDWKIDNEPERLPFAKHIKGQALISLVQKGLRYHHLSLTVDENGQHSKNLVPSMFFFGPESAGADKAASQKESMLKASDSVRGVSPASTIANPSKLKPREALSAAPEEVPPQAAKRGRKPTQTLTAEKSGTTFRKVSGNTETDVVNGNTVPQNATSPLSMPENTAEPPVTTNGHHDDRMEIDNDVGGQGTDVVMEDHAEEQPPPLIPTLTSGVSVEVQVAPAKVTNLGPSSAILSLDTAQTISRALWRPAENPTLIAQGDVLCGVWNLAGQDLRPDSVKPRARTVLPLDQIGFVTAASWDLSGSLLAVATYSEEEGQVHLLDGEDLSLIESLPASQRAITMLRWRPVGTQLLAVAPADGDAERFDGTGASTILSWDLRSGSTVTPTSSLTLPSTIYDLDCSRAEDRDIFAAGDTSVWQCTSSTEMAVKQRWSQTGVHGSEVWTFLKVGHLPSAGQTVVAVAGDTAALWLPQHNIFKETAHSGSVTGFELRSKQHPTNGTYGVLELATSSLDGTIKVWQVSDGVLDLTCTQQLRFEPTSPVMSLSYSPDGFCLAAASYSSARIWNAQHGYNLMAAWEGTDPEWKGGSIRDDDITSAAGRSSINGDGPPNSADHTLVWHVDSKRLAFGLGSQVSVINFQR